jgi:hypothetical protein
MTSVSLSGNTPAAIYAPAISQRTGPQAGSTAVGSVPDEPVDQVQLSPAALRETALAGRVAANVESGNLTSAQGQQISTQISSIHNQIVTDRQANGGTLSGPEAQAIEQAQSQVSQTLYSDANNGAAPPSGTTPTRVGGREDLEAGRIALNEQAGNLTSGQAQQLGSQLATIQQQVASDKTANGGTLSPAEAKAVNRTQNQFSQQIYTAVHGGVTSNQSGGSAA